MSKPACASTLHHRRTGRSRGRPSATVVVFAVLSALVVPMALPDPVDGPVEPAAGAQPSLVSSYGDLPLSFEANRGQTDPEVQFLSRGSGYTLFLTATRAVFSLTRPAPGTSLMEDAAPPERSTLSMELVGANPDATATGGELLAGMTNYLVGDDPEAWNTEVPTYANVSYNDVYPGVDLDYLGNQGSLQYDFTVRPGADPDAIRLRFEGADRVALDEGGDLVVDLPGGQVRQPRPTTYQEIDGARQVVESSFVIDEEGEVGFELAPYDQSLPLVIDPVIAYAHLLGGAGLEDGSGIAIDEAGDLYITGITGSLDFPTVGPVQSGTYDGGVLHEGPGTGEDDEDAFVAKINAAGDTVLYSTYLGGTLEEKGRSIAVDAAGSAYVSGSTDSADFPTTDGAFQEVNQGFQDIYVSKLSPDGASLVYSTFLGGRNNDGRANVAVDATGHAVVAGYTKAEFPTKNAHQPRIGGKGRADITLSKLTPDGSDLVYSTYLGGSEHDTGRGVALDDEGNAYVCGWTFSSNYPTRNAFDTTLGGRGDTVVAKFTSTGELVFTTYLGGGGDGQDDLPYLGNCIALDSQNNIHVTGYTTPTAADDPFPLVNAAVDTFQGGSQDGYLAKLTSDGQQLIYSTYLGGSGQDEGISVAVDSADNALVTGFADSPDFLPLENAMQGYGGSLDAFVAKFSPTGGQPLYSTYLGGSRPEHGRGIVVDAADNAYVVGHTESENFYTTGPVNAPLRNASSGTKDAFIVKLDHSSDPEPPPTSSTTSSSSTSTSSTSTSTSTSSTSSTSTSTSSTTTTSPSSSTTTSPSSSTTTTPSSSTTTSSTTTSTSSTTTSSTTSSTIPPTTSTSSSTTTMATSTSSTVPGGTAPQVELKRPSPDELMTSTGIRVLWSATDDGSIERYELSERIGRWGRPQDVALARPTSTSYSRTGLPGTTYCYQVTAIDDEGNRGSSGEHCTSIPLDDRDGAITYSGSVVPVADANAYEGTLSVLDNAGDAAELTFTGRRVAILARQTPASGSVEVFVDGELRNTVDLYAKKGTKNRQYVIQIGDLGEGDHTVRLVATGTMNPSSTGSEVALDGIAFLS